MYAELKKIYDKTRIDFFVMALSYIADKGIATVKEITDEQIEKIEGNGLMTQEFCQDLVRNAREICRSIDNPAELFQFCQAEDVYDVTFYAKKMNRTIMERALTFAINQELEQPETTYEDICNNWGLNLEDLEMLGYEDVYSEEDEI